MNTYNYCVEIAIKDGCVIYVEWFNTLEEAKEYFNRLAIAYNEEKTERELYLKDKHYNVIDDWY